MAASFVGWCSATTRPWTSPDRGARSEATNPRSRPPPKVRLANSRCRPWSTYQAPMLMTKNAPRMKAPISTWLRRTMLDGLNTMAQKSVISARMAAPSPTRW